MILLNSNMRGNNGLGCLVIGVLGAVAFFMIIRGLYALLYYLAPVLIVVAAIIRWQVFPATVRNWVGTLRTNPIIALLQLAFAIFGFPLFALYMLLLALGGNKVDELQNRFKGPDAATPREEEFVDFEELESRPKHVPRNEPLEPPIVIREEPTRKEEPKKPDNPYDQMFK